MTDSMSDSNKMLDSMTSLKENNNYFNMNQSN
jgi:hypothetical protein